MTNETSKPSRVVSLKRAREKETLADLLGTTASEILIPAILELRRLRKSKLADCVEEAMHAIAWTAGELAPSGRKFPKGNPKG